MSSRDVFYRDFTAPWDIGRPQAAIVELATAGHIEGRVLDVGCGTGEHALLLAARGNEAWGVDSSAAAIERARAKAAERGIAAEFHVHDALDLESLGTTFDSIIDSGLFHTFDDATRAIYAEQIARTLRVGGVLHLLCFSDQEPEWGGPRRIEKSALVATFSTSDLVVDYVQTAQFENGTSQYGLAWAWLARIRRS